MVMCMKTPEELKKLLIKKRASIKKLEEESAKILSDLREICPARKGYQSSYIF